MSRIKSGLHVDNFRFLTGRGAELCRASSELLCQIPNDPMFGEAIRDVTHHFSYIIELRDDLIVAGARRIAPVGPGEPRGQFFMLRAWADEKATDIIFPMEFLHPGAKNLKGKYLVYQHRFAWSGGDVLREKAYIGVTKRGWQTRFSEHVRAAKNGSNYRFHAAIRSLLGNTVKLSHSILAAGLTEAEAMRREEEFVGQETLYPKGLNMVPGGRAGLAYLHGIGAIVPTSRIDWEHRDKAIVAAMDRDSRAGRPNPLVAAMWHNDEYAERIICGPEGRLKPDQIRQARFLGSLGKEAPEIANVVGAKNEAQIRNLLRGSTYSRIA